MLHCESCSYFCEEKGKKMCQFIDYTFSKDTEDMDKYPCEKVSYQSYLAKKDLNRQKEKLKKIVPQNLYGTKAI